MFTRVTRMSGDKSDEREIQYNTEETRATRLKADTEAEYLDYRKEHSITDAEALRRLVRDALDDTDETLDTVQKTALVAGLTYAGVVVLVDASGGGVVGGAYIFAMLLWSTLPQLRAAIE
jgi:proteasome assembly chaperone (PAC2) family protein